MDQKKTGAFIAARRRALGLTRAQLAEKLAVTDRAVSRWETGRGLPDAALFGPICDALGVSPAELFAGEQVPPAELTQRTEEALVGLLGVWREWTRLRKIVSAAFFAVLALDLILAAREVLFGWMDLVALRSLGELLPAVNVLLLVLGAAFVRCNRDSRPVQWALTAVGAVLTLSAVMAEALFAAAGGGPDFRASPLYLAGQRAGMPCRFLFRGLYGREMSDKTLFFLLAAVLGLVCLVSGLRALKAGKK